MDSSRKELPPVEEDLDSVEEGVCELFRLRDMFLEQEPRPKCEEQQHLIKQQRNELLERFQLIDESTLSGQERARYLYLQGRTFNVTNEYDPRATISLSKAVKLDPKLVHAWNELGESYWKDNNTREAKTSFEGALKSARTKVTLRSLSIILRQETTSSTSLKPHERRKSVETSVELAKEAVSLDIKDGVSWCVLGNAYLCYFFAVAQEADILKLAMSAYRQAESDPIARGKPDLYYNKGVAHKYCEQYSEAFDCFIKAIELDPTWDEPELEKTKLTKYLETVTDLVTTRGKIKAKKLKQMALSLDKKMLGPYGDPEYLKSKKFNLELCNFNDLTVGANTGKVVLGIVVGSIYSENVVPFTFALLDARESCMCVTVYNWAEGCGVIIGDTVAVPAPLLTEHSGRDGLPKHNFKSIRVDSPLQLVVNGKRVTKYQLAATRISIKYESN